MHHNSTLSKYFYEKYTPLSTQNNGNTNQYNGLNTNSISNKNNIESESRSQSPTLERNSSNESIRFKTARSSSFSNNYRLVR